MHLPFTQLFILTNSFLIHDPSDNVVYFEMCEPDQLIIVKFKLPKYLFITGFQWFFKLERCHYSVEKTRAQ